MLASTSSATVLGADGLGVTVEAHVGAGLPGFTIVGLPDASCREVRDRARAATLCSGLVWPNRRTTVNLAPSALRKVGSSLDLAVAVAVLAASGQVPPEAVASRAFIGELGLDGSVRAVPGVLAMASAVPPGTVVVPASSGSEAALAGDREVLGVDDLRAVVDALCGRRRWPRASTPSGGAGSAPQRGDEPDLADVAGHALGRRALEVAAAGEHHLLFTGPPGGGKTMLARRLAGLLPPLDDATALEATRIHSAAGEPLPEGLVVRRPPLRAPHHSATDVALVGGGSHQLRPGEVSLAHGGVLFLDELGEFAATVLDALRTPLEEGCVRIARAQVRVSVPARVLLVAAMNPCPCGGGGGPGECRCPPSALARYARRLSGPLLDRFDLRVVVAAPDAAVVLAPARGESTAEVAERVVSARSLALARAGVPNGRLAASALDDAVPLSVPAREALERVASRVGLSARGLRRVRCVARTVADLEGCGGPVEDRHILEAIALRGAPIALPTAGPW
jgi:magnesium chelatase family protein